MSINGVRQVYRLQVAFCPSSPTSKGTRNFIRFYLRDLAERNPTLQLDVRITPRRAPVLRAWYYNEHHTQGRRQKLSVKGRDAEGVADGFYQLRNRAGRKLDEFEMWPQPVTTSPSVQGPWRPGMWTDKEARTRALHQVHKSQ
eukprot:GABV01004386.1.p1 GENE.GABV01004386.1~~GABV01004386.1.p1  ORF type:complete len:156 (-),score=29.62 GABV01004386.1:13-441(-)